MKPASVDGLTVAGADVGSLREMTMRNLGPIGAPLQDCARGHHALADAPTMSARRGTRRGHDVGRDVAVAVLSEAVTADLIHQILNV